MLGDQIVCSAVAAAAYSFALRHRHPVFVPFSCVGSRTIRLDRIYKGPVFKRLFLPRTVWRGCLLLSAEARDLLFFPSACF